MKSVRIRLMDRSRVSRNQAVCCLGRDVLLSSIMQEEKAFLHHGSVNCYDHSVSVAHMSLLLAQKLRVKVDAESLVRGALLHDLYLYDWHVSDPRHSHEQWFTHKLGLQQKRMLTSFPSLISTRYNQALLKIRQAYNEFRWKKNAPKDQ